MLATARFIKNTDARSMKHTSVINYQYKYCLLPFFFHPHLAISPRGSHPIIKLAQAEPFEGKSTLGGILLRRAAPRCIPPSAKLRRRRRRAELQNLQTGWQVGGKLGGGGGAESVAGGHCSTTDGPYWDGICCCLV